MLNKPNIQEKINSQKAEIIKQLIVDFKIPFTDIIVDRNSKHNFNGIFYLFITEKIKITTKYNYSNKIFNWDETDINDKINEVWNSIYLKFKDVIDIQILAILQVNQSEIKCIKTGKKNILYVHKIMSLSPITIHCEFIGDNWSIKP